VNAADPFGLVGQVLDGQFRVDQLVGEGGFSAVYRGHHQGLNEPIAIKCLKLPAALGTTLVDSFVQRFRDESRILYRLSQGNLHVVRSIAAGTTQAPATGALVPYMVLEWLEGRSVQSDFLVRRSVGEKGRSIDEVVKLFGTAADGLAYAHSQGVAHRDLNPGNLFLANTQQGLKMKVLDFGVAKLLHDGALNMGPRSHTVGQVKIFAPAYGAPEQFDDRVGAVGAASDVYAFALILLEALRDRSVIEGTNLTDFVASACDAQRRPTPRSLGLDVPDEIEQTFARATALDPAQRWHSAGDFWQSFTIAAKLATERKYENAARETPPLAMGGALPAAPAPASASAPKAAAIGGKAAPMARTLPLGSAMPGLPRPAPGASRPRIPTTIGIPMPSGASAPRPAVGMPQAPLAPPVAPTRPSTRPPPRPASSAGLPAMPHLPPAPGMPSVPRPTSDRPPASASGTGRSPQAAASAADEAPAAPTAPPPAAAAARARHDDDDDDVEEATRVHAPAPEILQTLALHDAVAARNAAAQARAAELAVQRGEAAPPPPPPPGDNFDDVSSLAAAARAGAMPLGDMHGGRRAPVPLAGTMMMAPGGQSAAAAAQAMAAAASAAAQPPPPPDSDPHAPGLDSTVAMMAPVTSPYAQGQGMPGMPPPYGQGSAVVSGQPAQQPQQAQQSPQPQQPRQSQPPPQYQLQQPSSQPAMQPQQLQHQAQQPQPQQHAGSFSAPPQGQQGQQFPPPSFAQPAPTTSGPKSSLPIVPLAIGLGVLAIGGIGLGVFAMRARHVAPTDPSAVSVTAVPVPVPLPVAAEPSAAESAAPEVPAAPVAIEEDAAIAAASASASASAAAEASAAPPASAAPTTATTATATTAPTFVAPPPTTASAAPKPSADPNAFNEGAARTRLSQANGVLVICHKEGGVSGAGTATVTFAPDGSVSGVVLAPPYAGTKEGECASKQFQRAKVPAFTGEPKSVRHSFEVP